MEHQIITAWAGVGIGIGQLLLIGWGLRRMGKASDDRNRQLDIMESSQREQSRAQAEALGKVGQALDRQGQVLADIGQGIRDQGQVLAELLRRTA